MAMPVGGNSGSRMTKSRSFANLSGKGILRSTGYFDFSIPLFFYSRRFSLPFMIRQKLFFWGGCFKISDERNQFEIGLLKIPCYTVF
jgi:hypothetical protein